VTATADFIGRGWSFPLGVSATGGIGMVGGESGVEESVRLILGTACGERVMRPEFGCGIHDLVFAGADPSMAGLIGYEVRAALLRWEPRIDVSEVTVTTDPARDGVVHIAITYTIKSTNDRRNLVFPFYTIPERE
jgi:phage baseplate assembly protein W